MRSDQMTRRKFVQASIAATAGSILPRVGMPAAGATVLAPVSPGDADLCWLSIADASKLVSARKVSPVDLVKACLSRIEQLSPKLNAFITVTAESALAEAKQAEAEIQKGKWRGPLHGIPIALKDLVDTAGLRTTAASALFKDRIPTEDAEVARRLKAAGAISLGKTNLHEFAYGGSSVISFYGPVRNPWQTEFSVGGSSGGSAAAVAAGMCLGAIGTDTGGSIREPAGYGGIVGLKPTYGRVSARGVIPLSWSLDHVGPMTRTVEDAALMLQAIAGYDSGDVASANLPVPDFAASITTGAASARLGIPREYFYSELNPETQQAIEAAFAVLKKLTASQRDIEPLAGGTNYSSLMEPYGAVITAEAWAYHAEYVAKTPELYQPPTLTRIKAGANVTTPAYILARKKVEEFRRAIPRVFDTVDFLITPTSPVPPFAIADLLGDLNALRTKELQMLRNTRPFNGFGLPTISVPCGFTKAGLPIGMQITGAPGNEAGVLRLARAYERETEWHMRRPVVA